MVIDNLAFAMFEVVPTWAALLDMTLLGPEHRSLFVSSANRFVLGPVVPMRVVDGGGCHPLDLHGWWHRAHIPTRGEEACDGFSLLSATAYDSRKAPQTSRWGGALNSSNIQRVAMVPVGGV